MGRGITVVSAWTHLDFLQGEGRGTHRKICEKMQRNVYRRP